MRHQCNCEYCDRYGEYLTDEDFAKSMDGVLDGIGDAQLKALWSLKNSVVGADRKTVREHIVIRITKLRYKIYKGWKTVRV